jgi:hypothetical protein
MSGPPSVAESVDGQPSFGSLLANGYGNQVDPPWLMPIPAANGSLPQNKNHTL